MLDKSRMDSTHLQKQNIEHFALRPLVVYLDLYLSTFAIENYSNIFVDITCQRAFDELLKSLPVSIGLIYFYLGFQNPSP